MTIYQPFYDMDLEVMQELYTTIGIAFVIALIPVIVLFGLSKYYKYKDKKEV